MFFILIFFSKQLKINLASTCLDKIVELNSSSGDICSSNAIINCSDFEIGIIFNGEFNFELNVNSENLIINGDW